LEILYFLKGLMGLKYSAKVGNVSYIIVLQPLLLLIGEILSYRWKNTRRDLLECKCVVPGILLIINHK